MRVSMRCVVSFVAFVALAVFAIPSAAQSQPGGAAPGPAGPRLPRFDLSGNAGWVNAREELQATFYDDWYQDAASFGVVAGFYWNEHVKVEVEAGTTGEGRLFAAESDVYQEHTFDGRRIAAGAVYQFGHNAWVHPFVGAGVEVERLQHRIDSTSYSRTGTLVVRAQESIVETRVRPTLTAGFKAYLSPRAFVRSDLVVAASSTSTRVLLRVGVGVDF